jgi:AhpD family alkylhydroperoxidase
MTNTETINSANAQHPASGGATDRLNYARVAPDAVRAQRGLEMYVRQSGLEETLMHLVKLRASYMNGCAYCVDMHTKEARHAG